MLPILRQSGASHETQLQVRVKTFVQVYGDPDTSTDSQDTRVSEHWEPSEVPQSHHVYQESLHRQESNRQIGLPSLNESFMTARTSLARPAAAVPGADSPSES